MKKNLVNIILVIAIVLVVVAIGFVGFGFYKKLTHKIENPIVEIEIEEMGKIKVELYPELAPNTVSNFIALANRGFYDGLTFHRTIPDFMIQGGDVNGDGSGSPKLSDIKDNGEDKEYSIKGEFIANDFNNNTLKMEKGVIAMARSDYSNLGSELVKEGYDSAGSQFFIMTGDKPELDGLYCGFGRVTEGLEIVEQISNVEVKTRDANEEGADKPVNPPVITSIKVNTFGVDYGTPDTKDVFDYYTWLMKQYGLSF